MDFLHAQPQMSSSMSHRTSILSHRPNISSAIDDASPEPFDTDMEHTATQVFAVNNPKHDVTILVTPKTQDLEKSDDSAIVHVDEIVDESTDGLEEILFLLVDATRNSKNFIFTMSVHIKFSLPSASADSLQQHLVAEYRQPGHLEEL